MPRISLLSRSETLYTRARRDDALAAPTNPDPSLHPFAREREYARALRAAKLSRFFAKPLVGALEGHADAVTAMCASPAALAPLFTGSADGDVRAWDVPSRAETWRVRYAHRGFTRGVAASADGAVVWSCGDEGVVRAWDAGSGEAVAESAAFADPLLACDAHPTDPRLLATCGVSGIQVWDSSRGLAQPSLRLSWTDASSDDARAVKYNPVEPFLVAAVGAADRTLVLFDVRQAAPMRKLVTSMRNNQLAWNPMEPMNLTTANEDGNLYTFDVRRLDRALAVHEAHVSAVLDVAYAPTGREFVSGSYDRSVRIWSVRTGACREVYTAPRMQRVSAVRFTLDARFVLSASDDFNVRVWKADASRPAGAVPSRDQKRALAYDARLLRKYAHVDEIRRVHRGRHLPKLLKKLAEQARDAKRREREKNRRVREHSKPESGRGRDVKRKEAGVVGVVE